MENENKNKIMCTGEATSALDKLYAENGYYMLPLSKLSYPMDVLVPELIGEGKDANHFEFYCIQSEEDIEHLYSINVKHVWMLRNAKIPATPLNSSKIAKARASEHDTIVVERAPQTLATSGKIPLNEEIERNNSFYKKSYEKARKNFDTIRQYGVLPIEEMSLVVDEITSSVSRNPGALLCLRGLQSADEYTYYHSINVSLLATVFAQHLGYSQDEIWRIGFAGMLHDIGKQKIPLELLNAPRKLSDKEFGVLKRHPQFALEILESVKNLGSGIIEAITGHHEKFDGSGYPHGLKGSEIHPFAAILSLVDVYDALTSERPYKKAFPQSKTAAIIYSQKDTSFSTEMVNSFISCFGVYPIGSLVRLSNGEFAVVYEHNTDDLLKPKILQLGRSFDQFLPQNAKAIDLRYVKDELKILSCEGMHDDLVNLPNIIMHFGGENLISG